MFRFAPAPRAGETLYSVLARLGRLLNAAEAAPMMREILGRRHGIASVDLPGGLSLLARGFEEDRREAVIDRVIDRLTAFPFHTAFMPAVIRAGVRQAMRGDVAGVYARLGLATFKVRPPERLRFCSECLDEMETECGDVWWRREHQLPGVLVCPHHAIALRMSNVDPGGLNRHSFVAATRKMCPPDAAKAVTATAQADLARMTDLAKLAANVLNAPPPAPRHDETLYSAAARAWNYFGSPATGLMHGALFGADVPTIDSDLPVGVEQIRVSGVFGRADLHHALHEWTAFPYYARFVAPARADVAAACMAGTGRWPHEVLGSWSATVPPPDHLRFCLECREDMLEQHPDLWWKRAHQLPSVLVCPDHGEPLRRSTVDRQTRKAGYVPASLEVCQTNAPRVIEDVDFRVREDLVVLARASDDLLDRECDLHPDERRMGYLRRLHTLGMLNRAGEADLGKVARALDGYWGETLDRWSGLRRGGQCAQRWLGALLWGDHKSPPLHHLLLEGMLAARVRW